MKIELALRETFDAESVLARALLATGDRHREEPEVFHLSRTLSIWCERHLERLASEGERLGVAFDAPPDPQPPSGQLLFDLRDLHLAACRASLAWTMLGQGAQAISDHTLLETVTASHPETIRIMKWTVQEVKQTAPQLLAS